MSRLIALSGALLCGCGGARVSNRTHGSSDIARCPPASSVRLVVASSALHTDTPPTPTPAWAVPVGHVEPGADVPAPGPLTPEAVARLGMTPVPDVLHLLTDDGGSCEARVEGYHAVLVEDGVPNVQVVALTHDCVDGRRRAWATHERPTGCRFVPARITSSRTLVTDPTTGLDALPPERGLPAAYARALPPRRCAPPCTTLHQVRATESEPSLAEVWVTYLAFGDVERPCDWPYDDEVALVVVDGSRSRREPFPNVSLSGVLVDDGGARVALFADESEWARYAIDASGRLGEGGVVSMFVPHEEDGTVRSLAPHCGP